MKMKPRAEWVYCMPSTRLPHSNVIVSLQLIILFEIRGYEAYRDEMMCLNVPGKQSEEMKL